MGELRFVGLGLGDERDLSARALRAIRTSTEIFWEEYTGRVAEGSRARLEEAIGRPVRTLDRAEVESGAPLRAALDAGGTVALLVAGDPFVATTHVALRSSAAESGHRWRYFPNATVLSAVPGLLGLMPYRFGRTVSVPFPADGFRPRSPLAAIVANRAAGLHSLALLDLDPAGGRYLTAPEA
ncbi:MAG: diphthine synthase, partial [Thermoplasmata archaeon]